ncbi:MAG: hypothetical protein ABMA64_20430 [Myxococcota bacterium]
MTTPSFETKRREPPPTLQGRYRLVSTLEEGKRGTTFLGYDLRLHRWRAISVPVDEPSSRRLALEAEILAKLEHPALERVVDLGEDGPISFVVRDRLHGSATNHLPMRPALAAFVVQRIADGLSHAHGRGILHGHLRPSVIRFSDDGSPVLTGFADAPKLDVTASGRLAEGWAHIAPEVRERGRPDVRAEVYSLGALLYTLVAGRHQPDLSFAEAYEGLLAPIPGALRPVILRACAHDPMLRPGDVDTFRALLGSTMERLGSLGDLPWRPEPSPDHPPDRIVPDPAILAILSVLGGPPAAAKAQQVDEISSTMDSEQARVPYSMPEVRREAPGFRDPFHGSDLPDYVDQGHRTRVATQRRTVVTPAGASVGGERRRPAPEPRPSRMTSGLVAVGIALAVAIGSAAAVTSIGIAGIELWHVSRDRAFVDAVLAERATAGALVSASTNPKSAEQAWFALLDRPTPENAAEYVRLVQGAAAADPLVTPPDVRGAAVRMAAALDGWER